MSNNEIEACQKKYKELEAGKSGIYNTIGRLYFEKYKDSPEGEFADSVNQINKINEEMKQIDLRIKFINGIVVCTNCGLENGVKSSFCSGCGTRLPHTYATDGMRCSNCGGLINPGQKFCGSCGAAIPQTETAAAAEPVSQVKTCPNCGCELENDAVFCSECGTKID